MLFSPRKPLYAVVEGQLLFSPVYHAVIIRVEKVSSPIRLVQMKEETP